MMGAIIGLPPGYAGRGSEQRGSMRSKTVLDERGDESEPSIIV